MFYSDSIRFELDVGEGVRNLHHRGNSVFENRTGFTMSETRVSTSPVCIAFQSVLGASLWALLVHCYTLCRLGGRWPSGPNPRGQRIKCFVLSSLGPLFVLQFIPREFGA